MSSLTNIVVLLAAARLSDKADFSVFSLVYMVYSLLLGASTAYVGQALVLTRGEDHELRAACRTAVTFVATASTLVGVGLIAAMTPMGGSTAHGLAVLGPALPVVLTQDCMRYCFSTLGLPQFAFLCDLVWTVTSVPMLMAQHHHSSAARLLTVWALSAVPSVLCGALLLAREVRGVVARPASLLRRGHLGRRFIIEYAAGNASSQLSVILLGLVADKLAIGALRGSSTLFGPMNVLFNATTAFGPPLLRKVPEGGATKRAGAALAGVLALVAVGWATVLEVLPPRFGFKLLGDTWGAAHTLVPAAGSQYGAMAAGTSALLVLRVLRPRSTLPLQVVFSAVSVACMFAGFAVAGISGGAWGLALGSVLKGLALWLRVVFLRRHAAAPAAEAVGAGGAGVGGGDDPAVPPQPDEATGATAVTGARSDDATVALHVGPLRDRLAALVDGSPGFADSEYRALGFVEPGTGYRAPSDWDTLTLYVGDLRRSHAEAASAPSDADADADADAGRERALPEPPPPARRRDPADGEKPAAPGGSDWFTPRRGSRPADAPSTGLPTLSVDAAPGTAAEHGRVPDAPAYHPDETIQLIPAPRRPAAPAHSHDHEPADPGRRSDQ